MSKNTNLSFLTDYITADITNGRIGINTPSPTVAFDVTGVAKFSSSITAGGKIFTSTSVNDNIVEVINSDTTNGYGLYVRAGGTASGRYVARFKNGADTDVMWLDKGGNVGIGTTTPSNKLEVIGASGVDNFILSGGGPGATLGGFKFGNGTGVYGSLYFSNVTNDVTLFQQYVSGNLILGTNTTERMRILSGGNVLIGTTSDNGNKLQVSGSISASVVNSTFKSYTGSITLASNQTGTIYTMGTMGLYTVQAVYAGAAINFSASAIFYAHSPYGGYVKCLDLYDGANIYLSNSGSIKVATILKSLQEELNGYSL